MSIFNSLQNNSKILFGQSKADVTINTKDGHSKINVTGNDVKIDTGCGDQEIVVLATNDLDIDTGHCGEDNINAIVGGDAKITTREDNDYINLVVNGQFLVSSGSDNPDCVKNDPTYTDNDTVLIRGNLNDFDSENFVSTGEGTDNIRIIGNNVDVKKAEGDKMILGFYGDNYDVNSEANNNIIGFWGDDININIEGQGNQDIKTLDFSFENGEFLDFGFENLLEQETYAGSTLDTVITERLTGKDNLDDIAKEYNLTDAQVTQLRNMDLTKETKKGNPYYLLYKDGNNSYQIGYRDDANNVYTLEGKRVTYSTTSSYNTNTSVKQKGRKVTVSGVTTTTTTTKALSGAVDLNVEREREITKDTTRTDYYYVDGVKNVNININENGKYDIGLTANDGYVNINGKDACNNDIIQNIIVRSGYIVSDKTKNTDISYIMDKLSLGAGNINTSSNSWSSNYKYSYTIDPDPIVLDTNKDGIISTLKKANYGVDITGNGQTDGAATGGDKMLAMSDLNKNGKIDGSEVFGDQTVSPFTGKKLNAPNGFEALKAIALEAKEYTGIDCMNGTAVDIQKLKEALNSYNVDLGLIGDNNVTVLDDLGDIQSIETAYRNIAETDEIIQHKQQSVYTTTDGKKYMAHDVSFKQT